MEMYNWFKEAKYGMMIHWGLYSVLAGEYKGKPSSEYAEWIMSMFRIPIKEYERLAEAFNPIYFNAEEWAEFAKECGMKYIVITAKHHDGFAMFDSANPFNIKKATPFGRDVIAELAATCRKYGLKLGLYYSQDLDWHEPNGGGYLKNYDSCAGTSMTNDWDFPDDAHKNYKECLNNKIIPQIKELLTNYGEISLLWFDMPMTADFEDSKLVYDTVKSIQPECLISSRLGNGMYDYVSLGDNEIPETVEEWKRKAECPAENIDYQNINGFKPSKYGLYETAATTNRSWGFNYRDQNWETAEKIYNNKRRLNEMGINYLINIGPDALGRLPGPACEALLGAAKLENGR